MNRSSFVQEISNQAFFLPRAVILAIPVFFAWAFIREHRSHLKEKIREIYKQGWLVAFLFYCTFILVSTVMARQKEYPLGTVVSHLLPANNPSVMRMNLENMLMFLPYTFLYCAAFRPKKPWRSSLTLAMITTIFIEGCQLIFWLGKFQVSDMIYNILGGMIGTGIWILWKQIRKSMR